MQNDIIIDKYKNRIYDAVIGFAIGDAMGVPVEFKKRDSFQIENMTDGGVHRQNKGTWSDDTSMVLATIDSIDDCNEINLKDMLDKFLNWYKKGKYTANIGDVFDIGNTVKKALSEYNKHSSTVDIEYYCGCSDIRDNGNGSLMRILPLAFCDLFESDIENVSGLTHAHNISKEACKIYVSFAKALLSGKSMADILNEDVLDSSVFEFWRLNSLYNLSREDIMSSGYVVDTLEASIWCFLSTTSYRDCVLKAVNLGEDTDTIGALAGALAGIYYGKNTIPQDWIDDLVNIKELTDICDKFAM